MSESSSSSNHCPRCGVTLPSDAVTGLCPVCLMAEAMKPTQPDAESNPPQPVPLPAELAPHFPQLEIIECLGRGGMGVVYKARQKSLNRLVALKLLAPERADDPEFAARFEKEAHALAALNHPNIVAVHDFGQAGGFYFLLMEFVDGVNLRQAMRVGRFTPEQALAVVPPVCEALQYAHEHGIVHRDIKPENLLLDKDGRVKIADFGIARMLGGEAATTQPEQLAAGSPENAGTLASVAGTPQYMAPEQREHRATDHRADIYSLGVVLYELLTGELPADRLQPPSRKVQIDVRLDEIVLRALEKSPELRYQTAVEFRTQVETMTGVGGVPPVASASATSRFSRTAIVGACMVAMGLLSVFLSFFVDRIATRPVMPDGVVLANRPASAAAFALIGAALLYLFVATLLGWIAVSQIRRASGRIHGLWLAVFDGLFFPLLAVDVLMAAVWGGIIWRIVGRYNDFSVVAKGDAQSATHHLQDLLLSNEAIIGLISAFTCIVVDFLIVRAVWRAVNRPPGISTGVTVLAAAAPGQWQPPDSGWGWLIGKMFGITFTSRLAFQLANLSALGFLAFLGFVPLPGWKGCFGFAGLFGLIGLANIVEFVARKSSSTSAKQIAVALAAVVSTGALILTLHFVRSHLALRDAQADAAEQRRLQLAAVNKAGAVLYTGPNAASPPVGSGGSLMTKSLPLAVAVNGFNARHESDPVGRTQPPLTVEEVLANIRTAMADRDHLLVSDETLRRLGEVVESGRMPDDFELEALTAYQDDKTVKTVWSVRLRIPGTVVPGGTTCISIREKVIGTRTIGEHERTVRERLQKDPRSFEGALVPQNPNKEGLPQGPYFVISSYDEELKAAIAKDVAESASACPTPAPVTPLDKFHMLELRWVEPGASADTEDLKTATLAVTEILHVNRTVLLDERALQSAEAAQVGPHSEWRLRMTFTAEGSRKLASIAQEAARQSSDRTVQTMLRKRQLAFVIGGSLWAASEIAEDPHGVLEVGYFLSEKEARMLAAKLQSSLP